MTRQAAGRQCAPPHVAGRMFDSTQGNPLFLEEMLRLYAEEGAESIAAGVVPRGVRDVIRQRLDRLDAGSRELLELAAVAGDELDLALIAAASGRSRAEVGAVAANAARVGVLVERGGRPRFSHALVREVLYRGLEESQRRGLHGRIAVALETARGTGPSAPLAELAHHGLEGPARGVTRAVEFAVRGGGACHRSARARRGGGAARTGGGSGGGRGQPTRAARPRAARPRRGAHRQRRRHRRARRLLRGRHLGAAAGRP